MAAYLFNLGFLEKFKDYAPVPLRLFVGVFIIWGVQDNILNYAQMQEFAHFLGEKGVPAPLLSAFVSAYVQLICGISLLIGAFVRLLSVLFIINFVAAVFIAHRGDGFREMFPALMMIAVGLFFLINGAGKLSVDEHLDTRHTRT